MTGAVRWLVRVARYAALRCFDGLAVLGARRRGAGVLLVRTDLIGDFFLALHPLRSLVAHYRGQGRRVVLLANCQWADAARELTGADEVWGLDHRRFTRPSSYRAGWIRRLAGAGFELVIQTRWSREALVDDALVRATGAARRVTPDGERYNIVPLLHGASDRAYTARIHVPGHVGEMERHGILLRALGVTGYRAAVAMLPARPELAQRLPALPPYAVLFPGASRTYKQWPQERFIEIGHRLAARGLHVVLAGGPGDRDACGAIAGALGGAATDLSGRTTLLELAELLRDAELLVGNDTAAVHIGAAVGIPVVSVLGGGHFGRFLPYAPEGPVISPLPAAVAHPMPCFGCGWQCVHPVAAGAPVPCIEAVSVDAVWASASLALGRAAPSRPAPVPIGQWPRATVE